MLNFFDAFDLGSRCDYLKFQVAIRSLVHGEGYIVHNLRLLKNLSSLLEYNTNIQDELDEWIKRLADSYKENKRISEIDALELRESCIAWERGIQNSLRNRVIFEISDPGGLSSKELLKITEKQPNEFISKEIWERFSEIEISDLSDSARCLLMGSATPSVMVALRGAEASIKKYYEHKTGEDSSGKTWRQLTRELRKRYEKLGIKDSFIGYLDYYGEAKRNIAQHPNKIYSLREAVMIFMQVINLIEEIYSQMPS